MQTDSFHTGRVLLWKGEQESGAHRAELVGLKRRNERAWIELPAALLKTRYRLNATEHVFSGTETPAAIRAAFQQVSEAHASAWHQYYLIAQPHVEAPCYQISDYIRQCIAGDLGVAERLRGRTVITLSQTATPPVADLLSTSGVSRFVERTLKGYLAAYGKRNLVGFSCELPKFLSMASVLETGTSSVPWSPVILETIEETIADFLPLMFYETYNSAAIRNTFWCELTQQFATCFLHGVRDFCHQEGLRFALSLPASAKALEFELGAAVAAVDCPILNAGAIDTPKRFVVAKWTCSNAQQAGISRKDAHKTDRQTLAADASLGFNLWVNKNSRPLDKPNAAISVLSQRLATGFPKSPLLMVAPTQSLWTKPDQKLWAQVTKAWGWLCKTVWAFGYDFRIISEHELASTEVIEPRRRGNGIYRNCSLHLNDSRMDAQDVYGVVLLPSCISLQEETVKCLKAFTKTKGRLIADEPTPYLLNGKVGLEPYPLEQLIYGRRATILRGPSNEKAVKLEKCLRKWVPRPVSVYVKPDNEETDRVQVHHRKAETSELFYLFNKSGATLDTLIELHRDSVRIVEWDLFDGRKKNIDAWDADGKTYLKRSFTPKQGRLFEVS